MNLFHSYLKKFLISFFILLLALTVNASLVNNSIVGFWIWVNESLLAVAFTLFFAFGISCVFFFFTASFLESTLMSTFLFVALGLISFVKNRMLNGPLLPTDFYVIWEAEEILRIAPLIKISVLLVILLGTGAGLFYYFRTRVRHFKRPHVFYRLPVLLGGTILVCLLILRNNPIHDSLFGETFIFNQKSPKNSVRQLGQVVSFIALIEQGLLIPPLDTSPELYETLLREIKSDSDKQISSDFKPDILVIMSESLFDPMQLKGIRWKRDPLKFSRTLSADENMNRMIVPTYGGKTANTEFGFLTGFNQRFLSVGAVAYESLISHPIESLPRQLSELGYHTVAIHPGVRQFWNREKVYSLMGFQQYISVEEFKNPHLFAENITDLSILPILQKSLEEKRSPQFRFVVTIQNHWPFTDPFDLSETDFELEGLSPAEKIALNHYTRGLHQTDEFHRKLILWLESRARPTVVMIFGDHLPALLPDQGLYRGRLIPDLESHELAPEDLVNLYRTPLLLWSNFKIHFPKGQIASTFAGVSLLKSLGLRLTPFQYFVTNVGEKIPTLSRFFPDEVSANESSLIKKYWVLQYSMMSNGSVPPLKLEEK